MKYKFQMEISLSWEAKANKLTTTAENFNWSYMYHECISIKFKKELSLIEQLNTM